jgi:alpha-beta hydrolase superfamily lysophospholipase
MASDINLTPTSSCFEITSQNIPARSWGQTKDCHAAVVLVHGLGAHSGWFETLGRRLKVHGIYSVSYDQRGFGKRANQPLVSYNQWLDELCSVYEAVQDQVGNKPVFLAGNSMGGIEVAAVAPRLKPNGVVMFSPGFEGYPQTFTLSFRLQAITKALLVPNSPVELPYSTKLVSRDEQAVNYMDADTLKRFVFPAAMGLELLKMTNLAKRMVKQITCPTLLFTAGADRIVSNAVNSALYAQIPAKSKKRIHLPEAFHDLMFDPVIDQVADEAAGWIKLGTNYVSAR